MGKMAKAIMIQGTMSNAGKSLLAAGLCRIFRQDGFRVAPFKSQNMALNSFITREGLEMGRAQAVQAEAAGAEPSADMNPVLLKPSSEMGSQVIVNGVPIGNMAARDYFRYKKELIPVIEAAYRRLADQHDIIVIEGAGSPAEINLKKDDIVNMGMAQMAGAPVLLAGDIDRGGVFAQLYGTVMLLESQERRRIKGLIINKFRGDKAILDPGIGMLEELCGIPVTGVVPYMDVDIEEEDSLAGRLASGKAAAGAALLADIAVIRFPRLSNFTDFGALEREAGAAVRYVSRLSELGKPDFMILPGTKNTVEDLLWLRQSGLEAAVKRLALSGVPLWGICGGYQMMGEELRDDEGTEGGVKGRCLAGMGLFSCVTHFCPEKTRTRVRGNFGRLEGLFSGLSGMEAFGYEIHMGKTEFPGAEMTRAGAEMAGPGPEMTASGSNAFRAENLPPGGNSSRQSALLCLTEEQRSGGGQKVDGAVLPNLYGTYVHGVFDAPGIAPSIVRALLEKKGLGPREDGQPSLDYQAYREQQYDRLAGILRESLDMKEIYRILEEEQG